MSRELPETVLVGRVLKPHGLRGEVSVESMSDFEGRFEAGAVLQAGAPSRRLRVLESRPHADRLLVLFEGVGDRDAAAALRGCELRVPRAEVPPAGEGEYYHFELLDCLCVDRNEGELGRVTQIVEDGGGLLLEVAADGRRLLGPFVRAFLRGVDVDGGRIDLELPPGLIDTCISTS